MRLISWNIRKSNAWELGGTPILGHPHIFGKVGESCSQDGPADLNTDCSGNTLTTDCVQKSSKKCWNHMKPSYLAANYHVQKQDMHQNRSIWVKHGKTIINHPFWEWSIYQLSMVIWIMVCFCFTHNKNTKQMARPCGLKTTSVGHPPWWSRQNTWRFNRHVWPSLTPWIFGRYPQQLHYGKPWQLSTPMTDPVVW